MTTGDRVSVSPADLIAHAGNVEKVASALGQAHQAAASTTPSTDAYGKLCFVVPILLRLLQDIVVDGIDAAEQSLRDSADRVRRAASDYRDSDERAADAVRRAGRRP